jgi:hypothetical protein
VTATSTYLAVVQHKEVAGLHDVFCLKLMASNLSFTRAQNVTAAACPLSRHSFSIDYTVYLHASYQQQHHHPTHSQSGQCCTISVLRREPKFLVPCERHPVSLPGLHTVHSPTNIFDFLCRIVPKSFSAIPQVSHVFVSWGWRSVRAAEDRHRNRPVCCRSVLQRIAKVQFRLVDPASKSPDCMGRACQHGAVLMHFSTFTYRFRTNQ